MIEEVRREARSRMQKAIAALEHDLQRMRTGRASPALLEPLRVSYYGNDTPLSQVANVVSDGRSLVITPWEKTMVGPIEKAIIASDLGLTPNTAGTTIRVNIPALTEERRRDLGRLVSQAGETSKISIRGARRDALQTIKEGVRDKLVTEDAERRAEDEIQKLTDDYVRQVDEITKAKEDELMEV